VLQPRYPFDRPHAQEPEFSVDSFACTLQFKGDEGGAVRYVFNVTDAIYNTDITTTPTSGTVNACASAWWATPAALRLPLTGVRGAGSCR